MTQNIEQRTAVAVKKYEGSASTVEQIAHSDGYIETGAGHRKSFPKISREWDDESKRLQQDWGDNSRRLQDEWQNDSAVIRGDWQNERNELSTKALGVKPWEAGQSETNINQQRRWTDNHTYLPKTVPVVMDAAGPGDNWIPYTADKSDTLNDVFGRKPMDIIIGVVIIPDANQQYPKLNALGKVWELDDSDQQLTVKSFSETLDGFLLITLDDDSQRIAQKIDAASRGWVKKTTVQFVSSKNDVSLGEFESGSIVKTLGYYSAFDGGNDEYVISKTKTHDLSFQIKNGFWATSQELNEKEVDIRKFGAVADWNIDGTGSNNSWVVQLLIDAKIKKLTGRGFFGLSDPVICRRNGVAFHSPSADEFRFYANNANMYLFDVGSENMDEPGATVKYFTARGVGFGGSGWLTNQMGIKTVNDEWLDIEKCTFVALFKGMSMAENANETSIKATVNDNLFYKCGWGVYGGQTRVADMDLTRNIFQDPYHGAGYFGYLDGGDHSENKVFNELSGVDNVGFVYLKPIWLKFNNNDLFELGGAGLKSQSPLNCTHNSNTFVKCGKNSRAASIDLTRYPITRRKMNTEFENTKIVSAYGSAVKVSELEGLQFKGTKIDGVGEGATSGPYDGFVLTNSDVELLDVQLDGKGSTSEAGKGRYWLNATNSTVAVRQQQKIENWTDDEYLTGDTFVHVSEGESVKGINTTVTASILDDTFVNGGVLTQSCYINLPSAKKVPGKRYKLVKMDDSIYSLIFSPAGAETINGQPQLAVNTQYGNKSIISIGGNWVIE